VRAVRAKLTGVANCSRFHMEWLGVIFRRCGRLIWNVHLPLVHAKLGLLCRLAFFILVINCWGSMQMSMRKLNSHTILQKLPTVALLPCNV